MDKNKKNELNSPKKKNWHTSLNASFLIVSEF